MTPKRFFLYEHFTTKWLPRSTYPVLLNSSGIRTVDYVDKGKGLWQKLQRNVTDLLRIANARTVYNDHTSLQERKSFCTFLLVSVFIRTIDGKFLATS